MSLSQHSMASKERKIEALGRDEIERLLEAGRAWNLAPVLAAGGALIFGDCDRCGAQAAAAVQACLASGKRRVIAIGPLAPVSVELAEMQRRVHSGEAAIKQAGWGIQGAGFPSGLDWQQACSLDMFQRLWEHAVSDHPDSAPELVTCYPFLANGAPAILPGMAHLRELAQDACLVAAMSPFRSRTGKDSPAVAARKIGEGMKLLAAGDYAAYQQHAEEVASDADAAQALRYLVAPWQARIVDTVQVDSMDSGWLAGALIALTPAPPADAGEASA